MAVNVVRTLREALSQLNSERLRIERQTAALQEALRALNGANGRPSAGPRKAKGRVRPTRRMSLAARKALSTRMKVYWAKRRNGAKGKRNAA
jgi:predicted  nucleic acid-binding Zn-ribbon protein